MDYATIAGTDLLASRIVFGTDHLQGRRRWRRWYVPDPARRRNAFSLLDGVFELGCNTFDTARFYGDAERTLGAWSRARSNRDDIVVITKGCHPGRPGEPTRLTPSALTHDLHTSLRQFGGDHFDLYLLHFDDPSMPVEPIIERLNKHLTEGKIRSFGASNWSHERIASANSYANHHGMRGFCASSLQFSLAEWTRPFNPGLISIGGGAGRAARQWYQAHDLSLLAYSSLARGFFLHPTDLRRGAIDFGSAENETRMERARKLAAESGATVAQVALAYVLDHPLHMFALVGSTHYQRFAEITGALSLKLDDATRHWLACGDPA